MNEDHLDFTQTYDLRQKTDSTTTANIRSADTRITNLKMLSKNVNGKMKDRLRSDTELMIDMVMHEPHVITMQKHKHELLNTNNSFQTNRVCKSLKEQGRQ